MAASENTVFQINFKTNAGTLINIYAKDAHDLEAHLATIQDVSTLINSVNTTLNGSSVAATNVAYAEATLGAAPTGGDAPTCKHGPMTYRTGQGAKGPWKGWMCPAPKGAIDKCDTVWVR